MEYLLILSCGLNIFLYIRWKFSEHVTDECLKRLEMLLACRNSKVPYKST